ncbi:hypothetical protein [Allohahella marinimesophila]|uniref:Alginate export domain-containing protein n=1 Tax=Allohahella marinimesophila TaxID=1054972 RepID=A0ABP7PLP0_9GAMM
MSARSAVHASRWPIVVRAALVAAGLFLVSSHSQASEWDYDSQISLDTALSDYDTVPTFDGVSSTARYEAFIEWVSPDRERPLWSARLRPWLTYRTDPEAPFLVDENRSDVSTDGGYAELREFLLTRHFVFGRPHWTASAGRQQVADDYGFWWDDSLESLRLQLDDTLAKGSLTLGSKQYRYNTKDNELAPSQADLLFLLGHYRYQFANGQWIGSRLIVQDDYSSADASGDDATDQVDFTGVTVGLELMADQQSLGPTLYDYYVGAAVMTGEAQLTQPGVTDETVDTLGWMAFAELGQRFIDWPLRPRVAIRAAVTDKPDEPFEGFFQNDLQSSRSARMSDFNSGLAGGFFGVRMSNLLFYGALAQAAINERNQLQLSWFSLQRRSTTIDVSASIDAGYASADGEDIGDIVELRYYWTMFPRAIRQEYLTTSLLVTASVFTPGNALTSDGTDSLLAIGLDVQY